jgi:hypothetical protein
MDSKMEERQQPPGNDHQRASRDPPAREASSDTPDAHDAPRWERTATSYLMSVRALVSRLSSRRTFTRRRVIAAAAIVGLLAFIFGLRSPSASGPSQTSPGTHVFSVTGRPTLVFQHFIGNVNITSGPSGQVSITEMRNGEADEISSHYAQQGDGITATVDIPGGLMEDTWVDFTVRVPAHAGLTATLSTGTLEATGLSGPTTLNNTNGAIWATNLSGPIRLRTQSGSINLTNVSGQVAISTQNGTITTSATHLQSGSSIRAESGTINFHGSLARTGTYQFQNSNGAIGLTLPASSAFALTARTDGGSINSDFHSVRVTQNNGRTEAHGVVGSAALARLDIQTSGGSIDLHLGN